MPIYISTSLVTSETIAQPLTHTRIGWQSILTTLNISGTDGLSGYPIINIANPATYERYRPNASTATINIDAGSGVECDYAAMQSKNVANASIYYSTNGTDYTLIYEANLGSASGAGMVLFEETTARYWRVVLTGSNMEIVAFKLGKALAMQRPIYGGHSPMSLSRVTAERPNVSETGQYLGVTQQRAGYTGSFAWNNLKAAWYREYFDAFVANNPKANPFFIAWRPSDYPQEVTYCWAKGNIAPQNTGTKDFMSVSMNVEGYIDGGS